MFQLCGLALLEEGENGGGGGGLFLWSLVAVLVGSLYIVLLSSGFDTRCYVKLAFIFNLLLLLFIPIYVKVKL